jgi:hypothetical protein
MDKPGGGAANSLEQECSESRQRITAASENPHIGPRVQIVFNRQQEDLLVSAPMAKLCAIGVLLPANAAQQFPSGGTESDKITAAAMVGTEDELLRRQLRESALDVAHAQLRAIPPDRDNFVIAKLRDSLDRVLKARREISAGLPVNAGTGRDRTSRGREQMNISRGRNFRVKAGTE